jgi:hypothetical protein
VHCCCVHVKTAHRLILPLYRGGGPPVFDGSKYHLYVSELAGHCGMGTWSRMSQAVHAVSDSLEGPYKRSGLAIPTQTHNTYYAYSAPDKLHLIYSIFSGTNPESCNPYKNCTDGTTPGHGGERSSVTQSRTHPVSLVSPPDPSKPLVRIDAKLIQMMLLLTFAFLTCCTPILHPNNPYTFPPLFTRRCAS